MKELEKTKRISISAVLFVLVVLIGILTFKRPEHVFEKNSISTLEKIIDNDYFISLEDIKSMDPSSYAIIDIRSNFEFEKGHIEDAKNISIHQLLNKSSITFFNELKKTNKTPILYGKDPEEVNGAWMLMFQLGYDNAKMLCIVANYLDNKFQAKEYSIERPYANYAKIMNDAQEVKIISTTKKNSNTKAEVKTTKSTTPKKIIPIPKKKKRMPEGGC